MNDIPQGAYCQTKMIKTVGQTFDMYFCGEPAVAKHNGEYICQKHLDKIAPPESELLESVEIDGYIWASMCVKLGLPKDASVADFDEALERLTKKK